MRARAYNCPMTNTKKSTTHTVSQIAVARSAQRGISADKAAKEVRGILRANFDAITKLDPSILKVKDRANDGNRWPAVNDDVRAFVLDRSKRKVAQPTEMVVAGSRGE